MMTGPTIPTPEAARQVLASLERYQLHLRRLVSHWLDAELYHTVSLDMQALRSSCHALPAVSSQWVALLIAHAELVQALWRDGQPAPGVAAADIPKLLEQVMACARVLQERCMALGVPGAPPR